MKKTALLLQIILISTSSIAQFGECTSDVGYDCLFEYPTNVPPATLNFVSIANDNWAGDYFFCDVIQGRTYVWSTCSSFGGISTFDSELTITDEIGVQLCYSDDYCGFNASVQWTATYNGFVIVNLSDADIDENQINTTIVWKYLSTADLNEPSKNSSESFEVYPTPTIGLLNISSNVNSDFEVTIRDLNGTIVFKDYLIDLENKFDISNLNSGLYIVSILKSDGTTSNFKIQKI